MARILLVLGASVATVALVAALSGSGGPPSGEAAGQPRVLSVLGIAQVQGEQVLLDIWGWFLPDKTRAP
jgi:hypothetical protein